MQTSHPILDCHHNDVTEIVERRLFMRWAQKTYNRLRYQRRYARHRR